MDVACVVEADGLEHQFERHAFLGGEGEAVVSKDVDHDVRLQADWEGNAIKVLIFAVEDFGA